jgi:hypothetical protein
MEKMVRRRRFKKKSRTRKAKSINKEGKKVGTKIRRSGNTRKIRKFRRNLLDRHQASQHCSEVVKGVSCQISLEECEQKVGECVTKSPLFISEIVSYRKF